MDMIKKTVYIASLIAVFSLAIGFNAMGARYSVGSVDEDWWIAYPSQSPAVNSEVKHPSFVLDALNSKPVVVYIHLNCSYCRPQTDAIAEVVEEYGKNFTFYDIPGDGSDPRVNETLVYDANGNETNVPLTAIVTLAPDSGGKIQVAWHSTENVTGKEWILSYVEDAVEYYNANSASWNK